MGWCGGPTRLSIPVSSSVPYRTTRPWSEVSDG